MVKSVDLVSGKPAEEKKSATYTAHGTEVLAVRSDDIHHRDAVALARSGKQQVLKRRFGLVSMIGFSCGLMCTWEGMLVGFLLGWQNGGPAGLIYGFLIVWFGNLSVWIVMGELSSMIPTAGGQYHWVSIMAPKRARRFLSYVTGWLTVSGWIFGTAATVFFVSSLIQALMIVNIPEYDATGWQGTLLFWAVLLVCGMMNTILGKALPAIEIAVLLLHLLGFFAVIVPIVYLSPRSVSAYNIFTTFQNLGGWKTQSLAFFVGLNGSAIGFVGTDGAIHMAEEVQNSEKTVARSMISSIIINGIQAFGLLLVLLLYAGDITDAVDSAPNGYPFIVIFIRGVGSNAGATAMTAIVALLELCSAIGGLAAASRMMWSFARDRGLPASKYLSRVDRRTTIPLTAVVLVIVCVALLGLINIGSSVILNDVISLTLEAFYSSYLLACSMLLYRRLRGDINEPDTESYPVEGHLQWGPWRLKGWVGIANNLLACAYLILVSFFSFWPASAQVTAPVMNYSSLVWGSAVIGSTVHYLFFARKIYTGPVVEVAVQNLDQN